VGIFDKPDFEEMLKNADWPKLVHYANYVKDPALSAEATNVAGRDVYKLVQYLYETAEWTQKNSSSHGRRLPRRGVRQINEATTLLRRLGSRSVAPLIDSVRLYDDYGDPDDRIRVLYFAIVFDVLEKMGAKTAAGLRELAKVGDKTVSAPARDVLQHLADRGLIESSRRGQRR
jgi:hypothetical protein